MVFRTATSPSPELAPGPRLTSASFWLGFKELPPNGVMLLYLSADGCFSTPKHSEDPGYDFGGVVTNSKKEVDTQGRWQVRGPGGR